MEPDLLTRSVADVRRLMAERLRVSGRDLDAQIRKAGRALPRARARDARYLAQAQLLIQNPKLARMVDEAQVRRATANLTEFLSAIDPSARRKDRILGVLGVLALNVLLIGAGIVTYMWWKGLV